MRSSEPSGAPTWFVVLLGIAIVFGLYYMWLGLRNFMATGAGIAESTLQAEVRHTATALRMQEILVNAPSPLPSFTPVPPCQDFVVRVPIAIVRATPDTNSAILAGLQEGSVVCVIAALPDSPWYLVDQNSRTRRIEQVYMHRDIIRAVHPTPSPSATATPSHTPLPSPTVTARPRAMPSKRATTAIAPPQPSLPPSPSPPATVTVAAISL